MRRRAKSRLETYVGSVPLRRPSDLLYARWVRELARCEGRIEANAAKLIALAMRVRGDRAEAAVLRRKIERAEEDRAREAALPPDKYADVVTDVPAHRDDVAACVDAAEAARDFFADASGELSQDCEDQGVTRA